MKNIQNNQDGVVRYKVTLFDGEGQHTCNYLNYYLFLNLFLISFLILFLPA